MENSKELKCASIVVVQNRSKDRQDFASYIYKMFGDSNPPSRNRYNYIDFRNNAMIDEALKKAYLKLVSGDKSISKDCLIIKISYDDLNPQKEQSLKSELKNIYPIFIIDDESCNKIVNEEKINTYFIEYPKILIIYSRCAVKETIQISNKFCISSYDNRPFISSANFENQCQAVIDFLLKLNIQQEKEAIINSIYNYESNQLKYKTLEQDFQASIKHDGDSDKHLLGIANELEKNNKKEEKQAGIEENKANIKNKEQDLSKPTGTALAIDQQEIKNNSGDLKIVKFAESELKEQQLINDPKILNKKAINYAALSKFENIKDWKIFVLVGEIASGKTSFIMFLLNYLQENDIYKTQTIEELIDNEVILYEKNEDSSEIKYINESKNIYWKIIEAPGVEVFLGGKLDEEKIEIIMNLIRSIKTEAYILFTQKADEKKPCSSIKKIHEIIINEKMNDLYLFYIFTFYIDHLKFKLDELNFTACFYLKLDLQPLNKKKIEKQKPSWERCKNKISKFHIFIQDSKKLRDAYSKQFNSPIWVKEDNEKVYNLLVEKNFQNTTRIKSKYYFCVSPLLISCYQIDKSLAVQITDKEMLTNNLPTFSNTFRTWCQCEKKKENHYTIDEEFLDSQGNNLLAAQANGDSLASTVQNPRVNINTKSSNEKNKTNSGTTKSIVEEAKVPT